MTEDQHPSTDSATEPLTEPPTEPLTEPPTEPLTEPPSDSPTEPPSDSPTEPPTDSGTEPPTDPATGPVESPARFVDHFDPVLCETDEDERILEQLAANVRGFERTDGAVHLIIEGPTDLEDVVCEAPFEGDVDGSVPNSYATLAGHHDGVTWEAAGGGVFGFPGLLDDGTLSALFWDSSYLEHSGNDEYADALAAEGLAFDDVREAFGVGQNWIVFDPVAENVRGEPALAFVSHGMCELEPIPSIEDLGAGQVLLRLLAYDFVEDFSLDPVYA